ncbi:hypothetical protein GOBAR_AA31445 [Gossypium barbadense]|uniref:Reverse transcriptase n=1 Tax=Gossypium barbadense TaxID=3634 RepID=A0A2P5WDT9_GOSBA|nr:hypothetical protein GOBAR_AA31445 [Gossypium barbadense]
MSAFREVLEECELNDLGFSGQWFTWERGRLFSNNIKERLDKVVAIQSEGDGRPRVGEQQWQFRFNADWILQSGFEERLTKEKNFRECRTTKLNAKLMELSACEISDEVLEEITEIKLDLNFEANKEEIF